MNLSEFIEKWPREFLALRFVPLLLVRFLLNRDTATRGPFLARSFVPLEMRRVFPELDTSDDDILVDLQLTVV